MRAASISAERLRLRLHIQGAVQGVGFRPFVFRLAQELGLAGWVRNSPQGVVVEIEGDVAGIEEFCLRVDAERPPLAAIYTMKSATIDAMGETSFKIGVSDEAGLATAVILPDIATCAECRKEMFDPANRRYRYPFINCAHCGPRFSIVEALPYDRRNTTMGRFTMCEHCRAEYENPRDRRFHAEPIACPVCGPHLEAWNANGQTLAMREQALCDIAGALRGGAVVALKGLGGFQLLVDARSEIAVQRVRHLKHREAKPFAVMYPSLELAQEHCQISSLERQLLLSPEAPIVLLRRHRNKSEVADAVAPGNPNLGVMLPYTPLHHLLLSELGFPIVATSGNLADEPICIDERAALQKLSAIADFFLVHNRPIARHVDDSVVGVMAGRAMILRRARGFAPLPIKVASGGKDVLAVGAHLKNTIGLFTGNQVFLSQHIGDLETNEAGEAFRCTIHDFQRLYGVNATQIACDIHPDYESAKFARRHEARGAQVTRVQHHVAHIAACLAENQVEGQALGVAWDGTGYGPDDTVWGGEFLLFHGGTWRRVATFRAFSLPGAEAAVREPRRVALALLHAIFGNAAFGMQHLPPLRSFSEQELRTIQVMLERGVNSPRTSSAGRLFDAVASLIGIRQHTHFEGQAAMELEFAADGNQTEESYEFHTNQMDVNGEPMLVIDWEPILRAILADLSAGTAIGEIASKFHNTMVETIVVTAQHIGEPRVALSGGCFQNRCLTERVIARLGSGGFVPYWHQQVPPNDGGIALGQAVMALYAGEVRSN